MEKSMKRIFTLLGLSSVLVLSPVSADELKNSLTNMLNTPDNSGMVDLSRINLNGKAKPVLPKSRASNAVIATVNGQKVIKRDADDYLKQRTQGKVTDFDRLPPEQRTRLIQELSLPMLASQAAKKELSKEEKQAVYTRAWTQKEALKIKISDDEAIEVYNELKKQTEENNSTRQIPPFESIKERLKMQMIEKSLIDRVMKNAKITVR
jgi:hypothetical protein